MENVSKSVVCFGEVLWDVFPNQVKPGGAPMNVAYHLRKFGVDSHMISRVGADDMGLRLLNLLDQWQIPAGYCPRDTEHVTGQVIAKILPGNEMEYTIQHHAAWDYICCSEEQEALVSKADAFVFGSLAARGETSRETLFRLLEKAQYKVFDINLRAPFYDKEIVEKLLEKCNLLKMNENELYLLSQWYLLGTDDEATCVRTLQDRFGIDEAIVTRGGDGASYYSASETCSIAAYPVAVQDTVGSGDSFLAAFLAQKLQGAAPNLRMKYASALGSFVASRDGACPAYTVEELEAFIAQKPVITSI